MRRFFSTAVLLCLCLAAQAQVAVFRELRQRADAASAYTVDTLKNQTWTAPGTVCHYTTIEEDLVIEGIVVSNYSSRNTVASYNLHYMHATTFPSMEAVVLQAEDGPLAMRFDFEDRDIPAKIPQFRKMRLNLKGTTLCEENGAYIARGLQQENILEVSPAAVQFTPAEKTIAELTPEDILTYITLKDCEFVFKDGAYINIYEKYGQSSTPAVPGLIRNGMLDGWASMLCDSDGNKVLFLLNCNCAWRRKGDGVPQGKGSISGLLESPYLQRYGSTDCYGIRVTGKKDIRFTEDSPWKTIAEWNWNDGRPGFETNAGYVESITGQDIRADIGTGFLYVDVPGGEIDRGDDFNNPGVHTPKAKGPGGDLGILKKGSLRIRSKGSAWWDWRHDCGRSIVLDISTAGLSGNNLMFAFTFAGGDMWGHNTAWFPAWWGIEYSIDGKRFFRLNAPEAEMRSLTWGTWTDNVKGATYSTSGEAGMGMTDHLYRLPAFLFGREHVYLRLSPTRKVVRSLSPRYSADGLLTPELDAKVTVQFGSFKLFYD